MLKTVIKNEIKFSVKSVRYLTFILLLSVSFFLFNVFYYKLCERNSVVANLPNFSQNSFETMYRNYVGKMYTGDRELLKNVIDADPFLVITFNLLLVIAPLFLILLSFPMISEEKQNRTINCFALFTGRNRYYFGKLFSNIVISIPVLLGLLLISYFINENMLIPVDISDQIPLAIKYTLLSTVYLTAMISMVAMASSVSASIYGSLGISLIIYYAFFVLERTPAGFLSPTYYKSWIYYSDPVRIAGYTGILLLFILVFNSISVLVLKKRNLT